MVQFYIALYVYIRANQIHIDDFVLKRKMEVRRKV